MLGRLKIIMELGLVRAKLGALLFVGVQLAGASAQAQYPTGPVKLIVGFAPSGGTDVAARIIARKLGERLGQQIVVETRAGAGGNIAAELVARANPDGYTILLSNVGALAVAPHLYPSLPYQPQRDFAPLSLAVAFSNVVVVHSSVKAATLAEYVKLAREAPLPYGTSGVAGAGHLAGELFKSMSKTQLEHVPYKGGGPAIADLLGGQVPSLFASSPSVLAHIKAGKIRALAVTSKARSSFMPEVPTVAESGFPGYEALNWYGFVAPGKTPREIVERLNQSIVAALKSPDIVAELAKHGMDTIPSTMEEMSAYMARESTTWGRIVKEANIKVE